jgi:hypothetical protein
MVAGLPASPSFCANMRGRMSPMPAGAAGTRNLIGFEGNSSAPAGANAEDAATSAAAMLTNARMQFMNVLPRSSLG